MMALHVDGHRDAAIAGTLDDGESCFAASGRVAVVIEGGCGVARQLQRYRRPGGWVGERGAVTDGVDEVAFVVDDKSSVYMAVGHPLGADLVTGTFPALHRIGTPVSHYLLNDLPALARHRMVILSNCFAPSEEERDALEELKSGKRIILFNYAAGLYRNGKLDLRAMEAFTGIGMERVNEPVSLRVTLDDDGAVPAHLRGVTYGGRRRGREMVLRNVSPVFIPDDPEAKVVGRLPDGQPGLVVKEFGDWTAVYSVAPINSRDVLRWLAEKAGAHFYIDTPDLLWANREMVAVCVDEPGERTIRLPGTCSVRDLYEDKDVANAADAFTASFEAKATKVFLLTPEER